VSDARSYDVVVAGAGNAALCAALSARESGASVLVLECAPRHARGGNSFFTAGVLRFPYSGIDEVRALIPDLTDEEVASIDVGTYDGEAFFEDLAQVTDYQADAELLATMTEHAYGAVKWLTQKGIRMGLTFGRQAFKDGEVFRFWGNAPVETVGGGEGLVDGLFDAAEREGVEVWYDARVRGLLLNDSDAVEGVRVRTEQGTVEVRAAAVVLATGGFQADPEMRAKYLGPYWDEVKVRGTEANTGDGIKMALDVGAQAYGNWSGCHAVQWDSNAPPTGDRRVGDGYQKHSYPFGIIVNKLGQRFVDEGLDFRNYTYARYGKEILNQPGRIAFQIFDSKVTHLLRDEYRIREVTKAEANTLEEVAQALGIDPDGLVRTVAEFNEAVMKDREFNPTILDGKGTEGVHPAKSNWAQSIDSPPFLGFAVRCGITFTFGGLRIDSNAQVLDKDNRPIEGLMAAGELVGGLYFNNYAGGTGLTSGMVFGRIAGARAAARAKGQ
jgi:tricarballylate dehydrogenase